MNLEGRFIGWAGLVIGLLSLIPVFLPAPMQVKMLVALVLALLVIAAAILILANRGPNYRTVLLKSSLSISDKEGKLAKLRREQTIRSRIASLEGIWWHDIVFNGDISNPTANGQPPAQTKEMGKTVSYYCALKPPVSRGEARDIVWTIDFHDAVKEKSESLLQDIIPWTDKVILEVSFPADRPCRNPTLHLQVAGTFVRNLSKPKMTPDGRSLVAEIRKPKAGYVYSLNWEW